MINWIKRMWCKRFGHNFTVYAANQDYYNPQGEMAGYCERCHFDTHGEY
jgi:hypothetical protein